MKTTFWILFMAFFLIYLSKPIITLKPFSVGFGSPYAPFGIIFLCLALACFDVQSRKNATLNSFKECYKIGFKDGSDFIIKQINDNLKEQEKPAQKKY